MKILEPTENVDKLNKNTGNKQKHVIISANLMDILMLDDDSI